MHQKRVGHPQELFDRMYPAHKGKLARVLVSEDRFLHGKGALLDPFKNQDMPRVAISVDMLDTGVDVPEADAVFIIPNVSLLVEAVGIIDEIYAEVERKREEGQTFHDTQGDLYEVLLSEIATAGKNGQFRTPRHIIQMIVELVDPRLGEQICDPACGTGGFLLGSYRHILKHHTTPDPRWTDEHGFERGLGDRLTDDRQWEVLRQKTLHGFDFDTTMVRIGQMNLLRARGDGAVPALRRRPGQAPHPRRPQAHRGEARSRAVRRHPRQPAVQGQHRQRRRARGAAPPKGPPARPSQPSRTSRLLGGFRPAEGPTRETLAALERIANARRILARLDTLDRLVKDGAHLDDGYRAAGRI